MTVPKLFNINYLGVISIHQYLLLFSVAKSCLTLRPHELQQARLSCPSLSPGVCSNSCPLTQWCHPTISSSVTPFSFCLQSFPESGSFPMSQQFELGGRSIGASASVSVLTMNIQGWFPLDWLVWSPCCPRDSQIYSISIMIIMNFNH